MSNCNGHRWSKFWWADWQNDKALQSCSMAARGLWIELLGLAHQSARSGYVLVNGCPPDPRELADMLGNITQREVVKLLGELERKRIFSRTDEGVIYSRRMVRDAAASEAGREWGRAGGNPNLKPNGTTAPRQEGLTPPLKAPGYPEGLTPPLTPPVYPQKLEVESQKEQEKEERKVLKYPSFSEETCARGSREQEIVPDGLAALLADAGIAPPKAEPELATDDAQDEPEPATRQPDEPLPERFQVHVRRAAKAMAMSIPYGEVRSAAAQLDALQAQPQAVGADQTMGLRWQPAEPVRSIEEQRAALLAGCSPEQIARAERYAKRAAA
jgi:hypothetical protein